MNGIQNPWIVAFTGEIGHGKSAAAKHLIQTYGFQRVSFADPLKEMLITLGLKREQLYDPALKAEPCELLGGKTPRDAMQTLGTNWGRELIHKDIWVTAASRRMCKDLVAGKRLVIDDLRFDNEAAVVRGLGGAIVKIERPGMAQARPWWYRLLPFLRHASERGIGKHMVDATVVNDQGLAQLYENLDQLLRLPRP